MPTQDNWRWCNKCQGLAFSGSSTSGACPAGGQHDLAASYNYALVNTGPAVSAGPPTHPVQSLAGTRLDTVIGRADLLADSLPKRNQDDWRWCKKCQGLAFAGNSTPGPCPAGGQHDHTGSGNYSLDNSGIGAGQDNWRWCNKCQGLAFVGGSTPGACPAGGQHDHTGSADYMLNWWGVGIGQGNWRWCNKCQMLAYAGNSAPGSCPAGGQHDHTGSADYMLNNSGLEVGQGNWRWCKKCQVLAYAGSPTPGPCPAGGQHDHTGSGNYFLDNNPRGANQDDWRWCKKCQGLAYAGSSTPGACPAGGQHDHTGSDNYNLGFLPIYRFSLDSFQILTTRSGSVLSFLSSATDTDYVGFSLTVGNQPAQVQTQSMGDLKDGSYSVNLSFDQIAVSPNETVVIAYHIVNSSQGLSAADAYLQQTLHSLMNAAVQAVSKAASEEVGTTLGGLLGTAIPVPLLGSALGALAGWLAAEAWNFIFPNCDGPVAAGIHIFTVQQLLDATRNGVVFQTTDNNPGVDSQHGCGSNSNYNVTWSIAMG